MKAIFKNLGYKSTPATALGALERNSMEVRPWSIDHERASIEERVTGWQKRLPPADTSRILDIVEYFGIRGATSDGFMDNPRFVPG